METYETEIKRTLNDAHAAQKEAMPKFRQGLQRLFLKSNDTPSAAKADAFLGGFNRRRFLVAGGGGLAGAAILAACGDDGDDGGTAQSGGDDSTTTTAGGGGNETDLTIARTAASLEIFAVDVYNTALDNAEALGISTAGVAEAATLFRDQHQEHADAFNAIVTNAGGEAYEEANPTAADEFADTIGGLSDEAGVLQFAYDLENIAAQTYQGVGAAMLSTAELRSTTMTVGGVEARHAAALAMFIEGQDAVPNAFQPTDQAVDESFFV